MFVRIKIDNVVDRTEIENCVFAHRDEVLVNTPKANNKEDGIIK